MSCMEKDSMNVGSTILPHITSSLHQHGRHTHTHVQQKFIFKGPLISLEQLRSCLQTSWHGRAWWNKRVLSNDVIKTLLHLLLKAINLHTEWHMSTMPQ